MFGCLFILPFYALTTENLYVFAGLEKDVDKAIKWYTSAAKAGINDSVKELDRLTYAGKSVINALL